MVMPHRCPPLGSWCPQMVAHHQELLGPAAEESPLKTSVLKREQRAHPCISSWPLDPISKKRASTSPDRNQSCNEMAAGGLLGSLIPSVLKSFVPQSGCHELVWAVRDWSKPGSPWREVMGRNQQNSSPPASLQGRGDSEQVWDRCHHLPLLPAAPPGPADAGLRALRGCHPACQLLRGPPG